MRPLRDVPIGLDAPPPAPAARLAELELVHWSGGYLSAIVEYPPQNVVFMKPLGLWVSVEGNGDSWKDYLRTLGRSTWRGWRGEFRRGTRVILRPDAEILLISNERQFDALTRGFGVSLIDYWRDGTPPPFLGPVAWRALVPIDAIRWDRVARFYQGIIVTPYLRSRRMNRAVWYYSWDCASGVIWDAAAVAELQPVPTRRGGR